MKKSKFLLSVILVLVMLIGIVLSGCDAETGRRTETDSSEEQT